MLDDNQISEFEVRNIFRQQDALVSATKFKIPELLSLEISKSRGETSHTKLADDKQCLFTDVRVSKGGDGELGMKLQ